MTVSGAPSGRDVAFCADDFGMCRGTNEGVHRALEGGLVGEVSLCVGGEGVDEAVRLARGRPRLGVGLHLALTLGRALTGPIRGVTDARGRFGSLDRLLLSSMLGRIDQDGVAREVEAQLGRLRELGFTPSHLDGHQQVHLYPQIRDVVREIVARDRIPHVRVPIETGRVPLGRLPRVRFIGGLARSAATRARRRGAALPTLPFVGLGLYDAPRFGAAFLRLARALRPGRSEWVLHPRHDDDRFEALNHVREGSLRHAEKEAAALGDPAFVQRVLAMGIRPVRFDGAGVA